MITALLGGVATIGYSLSDDAAVMLEKLPEAARRLRASLDSASSNAPAALQNVQEAASELQRVTVDASQKPGARTLVVPPPVSSPWLRDYAFEQSALLASVVAQGPIVLLLAYFLLASGDHFRQKLSHFVGPSLSKKRDAASLLDEIETQVQGYLFVTLVANVLIAIGTWMALRALGVAHPSVWGIIAGVMHVVPYLGAIVVAVAVGVAAFLQEGTLLHGFAVAGAVILVEALVGMVFMTWLQGRFAHINPAVLFIALLFFDWLWGAAGLLLCAPLVAIAKVICDRVDALNPLGDLLAA